MLIDVICYEMKNILIYNNNHKFKPTSYQYRIFYKTITIVKSYNLFLRSNLYAFCLFIRYTFFFG